MRWIGTLLLIAACQGGGNATIDGSVGPADTSGTAPGLYVTWHAVPAVPGPVTSEVAVTEATFNVDLFEVIGDAGGDTVRRRYPLAWTAAAMPPQEVFHDALPGQYGSVSITFGGAERAYTITGTWTHAGETKTFRIEDRVPLKIMIPIAKALAAGDATTIEIDVGLAAALGAINFGMLDDHGTHGPGGGGGGDGDEDLKLETGDPQMMGFRGRLQAAFAVGR
jgi:hypothetical protein